MGLLNNVINNASYVYENAKLSCNQLKNTAEHACIKAKRAVGDVRVDNPFKGNNIPRESKSVSDVSKEGTVVKQYNFRKAFYEEKVFGSMCYLLAYIDVHRNLIPQQSMPQDIYIEVLRLDKGCIQEYLSQDSAVNRFEKKLSKKYRVFGSDTAPRTVYAWGREIDLGNLSKLPYSDILALKDAGLLTELKLPQ